MIESSRPAGEDRRKGAPPLRVRTTIDETTLGLPPLTTALQGWQRHVGPRAETSDGDPELRAAA